jgi:hypothetical protein
MTTEMCKIVLRTEMRQNASKEEVQVSINKQNSRDRTIPTERPPFIGEVGANFCG